MSLHTLANHLQSAGRGNDKVLVHMTPGEVQGLQSLAMSQGGSLTINPQTGLPEAGILSSLLPMVAGFFLGPAGLGLTAMQSAVAVGALGTAATGSLGKGFMMGLGAYGGAGLGQGLSTAGAAAPTTGSGASYGTWMGTDAGKLAAEQATKSATDIAATTAVGPVNPVTNALQPLSPASPFANTAVNASSYTQQFAPTGSMGNLVAPPVAPPAVDASALIPKVTPPPQSVFTGQAPSGIEGASIRQSALDKATAESIAAQQKAGITSNMPSTFDNVGAGFKKATGSWEGAKEVWDATPKGTGYGLAATGISALQAQQEEAAEKARAAAAAKGSGYIRPYEFSTEQDPNAYANTSTAESRYFVEPRFIAQDVYKVKDGGLLSLAVGGQVEEMSAANAMGANTGYPMANLQTPMYANPMIARPVPTNVISPSGDTGVNTYSGEMRMAGGGTATASASAPSSNAKYSYDPATMKYTMNSAPSSGNDFERLYGKGVNPFLGTTVGIMSLLTKTPMNQLLNRPASNEPTVGSTSGGTVTPYIPTGIASSDTSMVPNIQLQPQQNVNQQLGLEAFYPMMEQQLAMKGSNLQAQGYAEGGTANGGYSLGSYSDGGRLLRGPGDGVSDSIPASIGDRQPARLADGEFVVPARIVSEIGNGSTEAGARKLYAMMDRVQKARRKTVGKDKVAVNTKADKLLPA